MEAKTKADNFSIGVVAGKAENSGGGAIAAPMPSEGIDISHWQGTISWSKVAGSGKQFAFAKATQGLSALDSQFTANWQNMKQAGILRGAYHYFDLDTDGAQQAKHFLDTVKFEPGDLPPVLDVEPKSDSQGKAIPLTDEEKQNLIPRMQAWLDTVEQACGCKPIIYVGPSFWNQYGTEQFGQYPLWVADYRSSPAIPKGWTDWTFWQYSNTGVVAGINGAVDLDQCKDLASVQRIASVENVDGPKQIPARPADAPTGSQFAAEVEKQNYSQAVRDQRVLYELMRGNIPDFYRQLMSVTATLSIDGQMHSVTYQVMPDYLAIGSNEDYLRMPMTPLTAQGFGDEYGFMMPTPLMVDQIHQAAEQKLMPHAISPNSESFSLFVQSNNFIQTQLQTVNARPGSLVDGDKKDVVTSIEIAAHPGKVVIYGWHYPDGGIIQPLFPSSPTSTKGHDITYMDYSHGLRMVQKTVLVDGEAMELVELLKDAKLCKLVSSEGVIKQPYYQGMPPTPKPPPA